MFSELFNNPLSLIFWAAALIVGVTVHEFAHAFTADRLGDPTPRLMGRLTLNPLAHLDPLGTIMIFLVRFGWGKPVQFDPFNLQNPRRDSAVIALAGPSSNLILALILAIILRLGLNVPIITTFFYQLIILNVVLAIFNLIPIHPLDGFNIVGGFLPEEKTHEWNELSRYGIIFLLALLLPLTPKGPIISSILGPPIDFILTLLLG